MVQYPGGGGGWVKKVAKILNECKPLIDIGNHDQNIAHSLINVQDVVPQT